MAGNNPGADNIGMGFYLIDHIAGNGGLNINDIIADDAVALIDVTRYVYVVGTDNVGCKADHAGNIPIYSPRFPRYWLPGAAMSAPLGGLSFYYWENR